jgi:hypothetical protein
MDRLKAPFAPWPAQHWHTPMAGPQLLRMAQRIFGNPQVSTGLVGKTPNNNYVKTHCCCYFEDQLNQPVLTSAEEDMVVRTNRGVAAFTKGFDSQPLTWEGTWEGKVTPTTIVTFNFFQK